MLEKVLGNIYVDEVSDSMELLKKYGLDEFLGQFAEKVYSPDIHLTFRSAKATSAIAGSILTRANTIIGKVVGEDKSLLERIVADIAKEFFEHVVRNTGVSKNELRFEIKESLVAVSNANGWNAEELMKTINFLTADPDEGEIINVNSLLIPTKVVYYEWLVKSPRRDMFIGGLKSEGLIKSEVDFRKLFQKHDGNVLVKLDKSRLEFMLVLIAALVHPSKKWIGMKGGRGHFVPLYNYGVDFEENLLFENEPKRVMETLKKKQNKYQEILRGVDLFLRHYK